MEEHGVKMKKWLLIARSKRRLLNKCKFHMKSRIARRTRFDETHTNNNRTETSSSELDRIGKRWSDTNDMVQGR